MSLEGFKQAHKGEKAYRRMGNNPNKEAINEATANGMRWVYIEPTKGGQRRFGGEARRYWNLGINGSGTVSTYSMRPGWHAGSLPTMRQIGKGPGRNLRDDRFVWVEGEISADVDYNEEAQGNPDNDIPTHIPVDGFIRTDEDGNVLEYGVFSSEQIKSAEAATYDDNGNLIPLSERFDTGKKDIRYSLSEDLENYTPRGSQLEQNLLNALFRLAQENKESVDRR